MAECAPPIDTRSAAEVAADVKKLLAVHVPKWKADPDRLGTALISIFARFAELIIERLNQAPDKNFLAFLDLLGAAWLPPEPARVPLTFSLAEGTTVDAVVPADTQVGAAPAADGQPLLFETERDLLVTSARLQSLFMRDPVNDLYADRSAVFSAEWTGAAPAFQGERAIEHAFYLGHETLLACADIRELRLDVKLATPGESLALRWDIWDGKEGIELSAQDGTNGLRENGRVVFESPGAFPERTVGTLTSRWLRCRLETAIKPAVKLPAIEELTLSVVSAGGAPDAAFADTLPLALAKEFFPFGEKPKLGDGFYLAHREAFSRVGAKVTLGLRVVDPKAYIQQEAGVRTIPANRSKPTLVWEFWNGQAWTALTPTDNSSSFTNTGPSTVEFTVPAIQPAAINGLDNYWIRVRIDSGDYGKDAGINLKTDANGQPRKDTDGQFIFTLQPSTLVPPQLAGVTVDYTQEANPEVVLTANDFVHGQVEKDAATQQFKAFAPFLPPTETKPALYLGFVPAGRTAFPNRPLSLYFSVAETEHRYEPDAALPASAPTLAFEYWNGETWAGTSVRDGTEALAHSGVVAWLAPADFAPKADFGLRDHYWLRLRLVGGEYPQAPSLRRISLNTTMAIQATTLTNEVLGSSDGNAEQRFRANHAPVLPGQQLEVEEAEMPTTAELVGIRKAEGAEAIRASEAPTARRAVWVRWHEVPDFYASAPRDRHYVLDRLKGELRFGDGQNGLIPPRGVGNIRLARYQTGGGARGNVSTGAISQLKTTVPYVDQVINREPALGGADAETQDGLLERAPKTLRHHERAVTVEDFEDLALLASPEVARALCVPLLDVEKNPLDYIDTESKEKTGAGTVSVIIVPRSVEPKPSPGMELIRRVRNYLVKHAIATANVSVAGPLYLSINVDMEVVLRSPEAANAVEPVLYQKLTAFLHPLTGGQQGVGWPFGERPQGSDVYRLIAEVPGIDYVRALTVDIGAIEEANEGKDAVDKIMATHRFLIYSDQHKITLSFEGR